MRIKLTFQYNGTPYHGFQRVNEAPTVQAAMEKALKSITGEDITLKVAGRTDKGVHALGQVAHFDTDRDLPLIKYLDGINHFCRPHVVVTRVEEVTEEFHARHLGTARTYSYHLAHGQRWLNPTLVDRVGHVREPLDIAAMQEALTLFPRGEIDCTTFRSAECQSSTAMVFFEDATLTSTADDVCVLRITANHFLHNMIRIFMGTLIEIGRGHQPITFLRDALLQKERSAAGVTFSPSGLYFESVRYPEHTILDTCPKDSILKP